MDDTLEDFLEKTFPLIDCSIRTAKGVNQHLEEKPYSLSYSIVCFAAMAAGNSIYLLEKYYLGKDEFWEKMGRAYCYYDPLIKSWGDYFNFSKSIGLKLFRLQGGYYVGRFHFLSDKMRTTKLTDEEMAELDESQRLICLEQEH